MSVNKTLEERGSRYGKFADHSKIAQGIQDTMRAAPKWNDLDQDMKQALSVIANKIARILNGDPFYGDNWHDIQGYAKLIEDRINMLPEKDESLYPKEPTSENPDREIFMYGIPRNNKDWQPVEVVNSLINWKTITSCVSPTDYTVIKANHAVTG